MIEISDALLDEIIEAHAADVAGMPCDDLASLAVDVLRDYKRLRRELEKRAKQLGVACDKHDLTHALACGRCLAEAREALRRIADDPTVRSHPDSVLIARAALAGPKEVPRG